MKKKWMLDQTVRHAIEETWAVFSNATETPNPALFLAPLADLARSNAFLWTEAGLQVQERTTRMVPVGQSLSRSLVLATIAALLLVGRTLGLLDGITKQLDPNMDTMEIVAHYTYNSLLKVRTSLRNISCEGRERSMLMLLRETSWSY